jgi:hypothetical protein
MSLVVMRRKVQAKQNATKRNNNSPILYGDHLKCCGGGLKNNVNNKILSYNSLMRKKVKCESSSDKITNIKRKYRVNNRLSSSEHLQLKLDRIMYKNRFNKCTNCVFFVKNGNVTGTTITIEGDVTKIFEGYNSVFIGPRSKWTDANNKLIESKRYGIVGNATFDSTDTKIELNKTIGGDNNNPTPIYVTKHIPEKAKCNVPMLSVSYTRHKDNCVVTKKLNLPTSYKDLYKRVHIADPCGEVENANNSMCSSSTGLSGVNVNFGTNKDGCVTIACRGEPPIN